MLKFMDMKRTKQLLSVDRVCLNKPFLILFFVLAWSNSCLSDASFSYDGVDELIIISDILGSAGILSITDNGSVIFFELDNGSWSGTGGSSGEVEISSTNPKVLLMTKSAFEDAGDQLTLRIDGDIDVDIFELGLPASPIDGIFNVRSGRNILINGDITSSSDIFLYSEGSTTINGFLTTTTPTGKIIIESIGLIQQSKAITTNALGIESASSCILLDIYIS